MRVSFLHLSDEVHAAQKAGKPVVALESTIISHGLPRPDNLDFARECEARIREAGAVPATIAVVSGVARVGLDEGALNIIARDDATEKVSVRDLGVVMARGGHGATTVAATAALAHRAGIRVFATGGLGGVHRGAESSFDESADLTTLSQTPITVVAAGVKSVLDIGLTLERMESLGIPVVGYQTDVFPRFWLRHSEFPLDHRVDSGSDVAMLMAQHDALGLHSGILVANPVPEDRQWDEDTHDRLVADAFAAADAENIRGKDVTPFLLDYIQRHSDGESLRVNLDVVRNNIDVAIQIATAVAVGTSQ